LALLLIKLSMPFSEIIWSSHNRVFLKAFTLDDSVIQRVAKSSRHALRAFAFNFLS
jgi:hypothetical protein